MKPAQQMIKVLHNNCINDIAVNILSISFDIDIMFRCLSTRSLRRIKDALESFLLDISITA